MDSVHHIWCPLSSQEYQDLPDGAETTLTLNYRDGGEKDAEGGIQFSSGSAIKKSSMKPITPDEFRVMKSYLNVM
ncbi:hypothetical protein AAHY28_27995 (plasmid) [Klebsiella variicola subsp. variicola]|uniref:hypothetical protein n=1 Tax=Klebsiella variicola TaxID=244366 RepID=UPI0035A27D6C